MGMVCGLCAESLPLVTGWVLVRESGGESQRVKIGLGGCYVLSDAHVNLVDRRA